MYNCNHVLGMKCTECFRVLCYITHVFVYFPPRREIWLRMRQYSTMFQGVWVRCYICVYVLNVCSLMSTMLFNPVVKLYNQIVFLQ